MPFEPGDWGGRKFCIWLMIRLVPGVGREEAGKWGSCTVLLEDALITHWEGWS